MSETIPWIEWAGGDFMPIPAEMFVTVLLRDGSIEGPAKAREFAGSESCWKHRGSDGDIVAYSTSHASLVEENRRLTQERDDLAKALDSAEIDGGLTSNGNLWRFWSARAKGVAAKYIILKSRAEKAEAENRRLREANRKLHRRAQVGEAIYQSVKGDLEMWMGVLSRPRHDASFWLFDFALRHMDKRIRKATAALQPVAGKEG